LFRGRKGKIENGEQGFKTIVGPRLPASKRESLVVSNLNDAGGGAGRRKGGIEEYRITPQIKRKERSTKREHVFGRGKNECTVGSGGKVAKEKRIKVG